MSYTEFLDSKRLAAPVAGVAVPPDAVHSLLFAFQRDLTRWALRKGRSALFADTGLGKTLMQLEWARLTGERALIVAPLSVARQTQDEAHKLGMDVPYSRTGEATGAVTVTNYEMIEHFDPAQFGAVVLDESSILKSLTGKTRERLAAMFAGTPYRLCCTATPAPNDIAEIANHAEFLGIMTRADMLATFFVHDDEGWRLKGHAQDQFYRWLASWGMSIRRPSDLGYEDDGFILPPLHVEQHVVDTGYRPADRLFFDRLHGIQDRIEVRRATLAERVARAAELIGEAGEQWLAWVGMNEEGRLLRSLLPGAVLMEGSDKPDKKIGDIHAFQDGSCRVLISKPRIAGFGMNLQNAARMVFVGLGDSWEQYYQCIRRCYRFGQRRRVEAHIVVSDAEREVYENVLRKEREAEVMAECLIRNVAEFEREEIGQVARSDYRPAQPMRLPEWLAPAA